jgi:Ni/Co efflux regulator RcnB
LRSPLGKLDSCFFPNASISARYNHNSAIAACRFFEAPTLDENSAVERADEREMLINKKKVSLKFATLRRHKHTLVLVSDKSSKRTFCVLPSRWRRGAHLNRIKANNDVAVI